VHASSSWNLHIANQNISNIHRILPLGECTLQISNLAILSNWITKGYHLSSQICTIYNSIGE
jgi:zona occludens toxin (predicted ATPase)